MSSQLEKYLRDVAVELHSLPREQREEEIEEIRAHLTAYAEKRRAAGAGEEEAMRAAITQFGRPVEVGRKIARAPLCNKAYMLSVAGVIALALFLSTGQILHTQTIPYLAERSFSSAHYRLLR